MRAEPSHKSEQVSQLLFGELCEVTEAAKDFLKVKCRYDGYEGWCQNTQLCKSTIPEEEKHTEILSNNFTAEISINGALMIIPLGSSLSVFQQGAAELQNNKLQFEGRGLNPQESRFNEASIKAIANKYLNTAYLWGGKSVFGIDCSGFTQMVFKFLNVFLYRDAHQQATQGEVAGFLEEARCGDLAFFDNDEGKIIHTGILLKSSSIIHASGKVRIDGIDHTGIINVETQQHTHKLRIIKRYARLE